MLSLRCTGGLGANPTSGPGSPRSAPCPGAASSVLGHPLPLPYSSVSKTSTQAPGLLGTWHCARCEGHRSRGHGRVSKEEWCADRTSVSSVSEDLWLGLFLSLSCCPLDSRLGQRGGRAAGEEGGCQKDDRALPAVGPPKFPSHPLLASPLPSWIYPDLSHPSGSFPLLCLRFSQTPQERQILQEEAALASWGSETQAPLTVSTP